MSISNQTDLPDPAVRAPGILLVEDEVLIRLALSEFLRDCGYFVYGVGSAEAAMEVLEANVFGIDIVFTDIQLDGQMDGLTLVKWIRANHPDIAVLITTGDRQKMQAATGLCEAHDLIWKPHDYDLVLTRIKSALRVDLPAPRHA